MINLFEYQNKAPFPDSFQDIEAFLDEIWKKREKSEFYLNGEEDRIESQRFIQFLHQSGEIKSNKYVGVIHYGAHKINLLPKIFFDSNKEYSSTQITQIQNHIIWWLSYCRKIKFPNYQSALGSQQSDFFEVLIYLFSKYTRELLSNSIYQQYEEVHEELTFIKGRLNATDYINQNLSTGRWHRLNCSYDSFVFDNKFNRIIKYVTTFLFNACTSQDNKKNLREILFILDEVSDERATAEQCASIKFNPMLENFDTVRDFCHLFLSNSISFDYKNDLKLFAFLLPMDYLFEDFIFGFIEKEVESITAKAQRSDVYLDHDKFFNLKPDLFIKSEFKSLIADTKYKIVYSNETDPKKGISQSDLYQMIAYAIRFEVDEIILFYPNTVNDIQANSTSFIIEDTLAGNRKIFIKAFKLPFLSLEVLNTGLDFSLDINTLFESTRAKLSEKILNIFEGERREDSNLGEDFGS
ncbi:McrC family protein [Albibacterium bauzanense]|uniref:5-methylcytosine-specific restriction enzyme subunit McrC n=1 Tax=Albibacterium bauzanense TaxID=653929 RepID=A0A4R1LTQ7_9SPHI|nr:hypothetical protein [Albibacterium bauzanense]TCK80649.1 5-methylcytosine-specific restriction enzyme subunit McrC [Albibacterium bauzanense]